MSCHPSSEGTLLSPLVAVLASLQVPMCLPEEKIPGGVEGNELTEGVSRCVAGALAVIRLAGGLPF